MTERNRITKERVEVKVAAVRASVGEKLGDIWWAFLLRGIFAIALGIFALFWPGLSLTILVLAVGLYLLADGAVGLIGALRHPELREYLTQALVFLAIGAILVFWPSASLRTVLVLLGAAAAFAGASQILTARRLPQDDPERSSVMMIGIVVVVVGLILAFWPGSGVAVISWVIGLAAILIGILLVYLGSRANKLAKRID